MTSIPEVESVWDYPRPPRLERTDAHVVVMFADRCWSTLAARFGYWKPATRRRITSRLPTSPRVC